MHRVFTSPMKRLLDEIHWATLFSHRTSPVRWTKLSTWDYSNCFLWSGACRGQEPDWGGSESVGPGRAARGAASPLHFSATADQILVGLLIFSGSSWVEDKPGNGARPHSWNYNRLSFLTRLWALMTSARVLSPEQVEHCLLPASELLFSWPNQYWI